MKLSNNRKKQLNRRVSVLLILLMLASALGLTSCGRKTEKLTMYVGLGQAGSGYYESIRSAIKSATGVEIEFVFSNTMDTTNAMVNKIQNNDLPADIVITASKTDNSYCRTSLMDLSSYTNLPDHFNITDIEALADSDGAVYQLPFSTRLIGITYNKTIFEEQGWELPKTFEDMKTLKSKASAAGIKFAISGGAATGHGFNYLFHTMGADYLIKPAGTDWLTKFQKGKADASEFEKASDYFRRYAEAGLFGEVHAEDWNANKQYCEERAVFYYNILNDVSSYNGYQYNESGRIKGASYNAAGEVIAEKKADGEAVLIDGQYVLYDKANKEHKGLTRYTIPGAVILHDEYCSMPWISEDGNTNCFTKYDNMFIGLNKELAEKGNEEKLEAAAKALEYMLSDEAIQIFSDICPDGIVRTNAYEIKSDRLYYSYAEKIHKGYLMPWYYNYFDVDSITNVGALVNSYLMGDSSVSMSDIIDELEYRNDKNLEGTKDVLVKMMETFDYEDAAKLQAIANGLAADTALKAAGLSDRADISVIPYIEEPGDINKEIQLPVVQEKIYAGDLEESKLSSYVSSLTNKLAIVYMSGKDIKALVRKGFDSSADYGYEHVFKYMSVSKADAEISDNKEYLLVIPWALLGDNKCNEYLKKGKLISKDGEAVQPATLDGLRQFLKEKQELSKEDLRWE